MTPAKPEVVSLEVTSRCNLGCFMCPRERLHRLQGDLEWETFDAVSRMIRPVAPVEEFDLTGFGEPLTRADLLDAMLSRIEDWRLAPRTRVTTNGTLMDPSVAEKLLSHPSLLLEVSVLASRPQAYFLVTGQNLLTRVETNLEYLLERRRELGQVHPRVVVKSVRMGGLEGDSQDFLARWNGKVDEVRFETYHRWGGVAPDLRTEVPANRYPCPHLWRTLVVSRNGEVAACDVDFDRAATVGHVEEGLDAVWGGAGLEEIRRMHQEGRWDEIRRCRDCDAWSRLPDPRLRLELPATVPVAKPARRRKAA